MPTILQDRSVFSVLGLCISDTARNSLTAEAEVDKKKFSHCGNAWAEGSTSVHQKNNCKSCSFLQLDGSLRKSSQSFVGKSNWVLLKFDSSEQDDVGIYRLPKLHHIHCNGLSVSEYDVHVCKSQFLLLLLAFLQVVIETFSISLTYIYQIWTIVGNSLWNTFLWCSSFLAASLWSKWASKYSP